MTPAFASIIGALIFTAALDDAAAPAKKPAKPAANARVVPARPGEAARAPQALPAQPVDPHAGHNHGAATPTKFPEGPAGTMVITETVYDAGDVARGQEIKHAFVVKNTGKHPLHIEAKAG